MTEATGVAKVVALAHAFSDVLAGWLTDEEKHLVLETNRKEPGYCATHKVCDPNMAMLEAFNRLFPEVTFEMTMNDDEQIRLWEQAWNVAKEYGFWWKAGTAKQARAAENDSEARGRRYVVRDGSGEYVSARGRTPASDEAQEFETEPEAAAACTRTTDQVLLREDDPA